MHRNSGSIPIFQIWLWPKPIFLLPLFFIYLLGMGTSSKFQTQGIEGILLGSIKYSFNYYLFLECNTSAAEIGLMMNSNITNLTFNEYSQSNSYQSINYLTLNLPLTAPFSLRTFSPLSSDDVPRWHCIFSMYKGHEITEPLVIHKLRDGIPFYTAKPVQSQFHCLLSSCL